MNPDLVARDDEGKPNTVRYEAVNVMLLNEFLKEHRRIEQQDHKMQQQEATIAQLKSVKAHQQKDFEATAARQQKQIEALTAGLQQVSAQLDASKPAPRVVLNDHQKWAALKYWEIIADTLSKSGWSWGCVSAIDSNGRTIRIADAHRGNGKRLGVRSDEKLTAFVERESAIHSGQWLAPAIC